MKVILFLPFLLVRSGKETDLEKFKSAFNVMANGNAKTNT